MKIFELGGFEKNSQESIRICVEFWNVFINFVVLIVGP